MSNNSWNCHTWVVQDLLKQSKTIVADVEMTDQENGKVNMLRHLEHKCIKKVDKKANPN